MTRLVAYVASYHSTPESNSFFLSHPGACFYTPLAMEVIGTTDSDYLDGPVNTFTIQCI